MHYLKLTTTSGFACVKVSFTSDPSVINAEFRSIEETNNALSLDGLNIMNTVCSEYNDDWLTVLDHPCFKNQALQWF